MNTLSETMTYIYGEGLEKLAMDPFTLMGVAKLLGLAGLSHVGVNAVYKGLQAASKPRTGFVDKLIPRGVKEFMPKMEEKQLARGIRKGMSGEQPGFLRRVGEKWVAPEFWAHEHIGEAIGKNMPKDNIARAALLAGAAKASDAAPILKDVPILRHAGPAARRVLREGLPVGEAPKTPIRNALAEAGSYAVGAPVVAAMPDMALHLGVNKMRSAVSNSARGKQWIKDQAIEGVDKALAGRGDSLKDHAIDYFMSPAARDPARITKRLTEHAVDSTADAITKLIKPKTSAS
jgi:hypothetical protein